ncbi:MAG: sporulation protein YabP [Bacilli bacterium]|jgi:sporulation protein YabP|nr:sporulation protein YabP [Bacilli bacterium]
METQSMNHIVKMVDRKSIVISGIKRIINFDDKQFSLESNMGDIIIKGESLEMIKLDTIDGNVSIKGSIDSIIYSNVKTSESLITKLFK